MTTRFFNAPLTMNNLPSEQGSEQGSERTTRPSPAQIASESLLPITEAQAEALSDEDLFLLDIRNANLRQYFQYELARRGKHGNELAAALAEGEFPVEMTIKCYLHNQQGNGFIADEQGERIFARDLDGLIREAIRVCRVLVEEARAADDYIREQEIGYPIRWEDWAIEVQDGDLNGLAVLDMDELGYELSDDGERIVGSIGGKGNV